MIDITKISHTIGGRRVKGLIVQDGFIFGQKESCFKGIFHPEQWNLNGSYGESCQSDSCLSVCDKG